MTGASPVPIGRRFAFSPSGLDQDSPRWITVIGIVGDTRNRSLELSPTPEIYLPYASFPPGTMSLVVRGVGDLAPLASAIRKQIRRVDPLQAVSDVQTVEEIIRGQEESNLGPPKGRALRYPVQTRVARAKSLR